LAILVRLFWKKTATGWRQSEGHQNFLAEARDCLDDAESTEPDYWQKEI